MVSRDEGNIDGVLILWLLQYQEHTNVLLYGDLEFSHDVLCHLGTRWHHTEDELVGMWVAASFKPHNVHSRLDLAPEASDCPVRNLDNDGAAIRGENND